MTNQIPKMRSPEHSSTPHRLGLLLVGVKESNVSALQYLLLQINQLQQTFECEFLPAFEDEFLTRLKSKDTISRDETKKQIPAFSQRYLARLEQLISTYGLREQPPEYFVVISLARFDDEYYSTRTGNVSVIALGNWERHMAPPTIVEFLLTLVVREAIAALSPSLRGSIHLGTKGCVCDFTLNLEDARLKVLSGFVCGYCRTALETDNLPHLATEIERILGKRWLGKATNPATPAAIVSKLGHNLFTTKGLQPTKWERFVSALQDEGAKALMKVAGFILVALLAGLAGALGWVGIENWLRK